MGPEGPPTSFIFLPASSPEPSADYFLPLQPDLGDDKEWGEAPGGSGEAGDKQRGDEDATEEGVRDNASLCDSPSDPLFRLAKMSGNFRD